MKYIIFILMFLLSFSIVSAYDLNSTVNIQAAYRVNGTLTSALANITILYPDSSIAVNEANMPIQSVGLFEYNYTCSSIGTHTAIAKFRNSTVSYLGNDTSTFQCGDVNKLSWSACPSGTNGYFGMWILMGFFILLAIVGFMIKSSLLAIASGVMMLIYGLMTFGCGDIIAYFNMIFGIIFMLVGLMS